ncbi:MAG TPA: cytochrome c [Gammaproteobacteria bacterium]|nr:cytochrome c [Gammaproteobacteria bacterium]HIK70360.1 cytochrome c [Pseudomonadales bacterium]
MIKILISTLLISVVSSLASTVLKAAPATPAMISGNADKGEALYYNHGCYACHGYNGIGKHNLANDVSGIMMSEAVYLIFLRARSELNPPLPTQRMPHYPESSLSDQEALDIYAYIRTFKDTPPEAESNATMRAIINSAQSQAPQ